MIKGVKPNFHMVKSHDNRNNMNNDDEANSSLNGNTINDNSFNEDESNHSSNKMNSLNFNSTITPMPNSIELLDNIIKARDELFEKQLGDGLKAHRKLSGLVMK